MSKKLFVVTEKQKSPNFFLTLLPQNRNIFLKNHIFLLDQPSPPQPTEQKVFYSHSKIRVGKKKSNFVRQISIFFYSFQSEILAHSHKNLPYFNSYYHTIILFILSYYHTSIEKSFLHPFEKADFSPTEKVFYTCQFIITTRKKVLNKEIFMFVEKTEFLILALFRRGF